VSGTVAGTARRVLRTTVPDTFLNHGTARKVLRTTVPDPFLLNQAPLSMLAEEPIMSKPDFQHIRLSTVGDVTLVELTTKDMQGPKLAQELGGELAQVLAQDWAKRLLLDFRKIAYFSSTAFAVLFRLVSDARKKGLALKFCSLEPAVELGADIVGLNKVVEIHETQDAALKAFSKA
jgi:anti-sigma B factor antagonist